MPLLPEGDVASGAEEVERGVAGREEGAVVGSARLSDLPVDGVAFGGRVGEVVLDGRPNPLHHSVHVGLVGASDADVPVVFGRGKQVAGQGVDDRLSERRDGIVERHHVEVHVGLDGDVLWKVSDVGQRAEQAFLFTGPQGCDDRVVKFHLGQSLRHRKGNGGD